MGIKPRSIKKNLSKKRASKKGLLDALFTSTQQKVLGLLFGNPDRRFFATELIQLAQAGSGAVQRELAALVEAGLVTVEVQGKQKYYHANADSAIFEELRSITLKTVGLSLPLKKALENINEEIEIAFIYGSIAKGTDKATSDIDLFIVSDNLSLDKVYEALSPAEKSLGRTINPTIYTSDELRKKIKSKSSFIEKVFGDKRIILLGDENALKALR